MQRADATGDGQPVTPGEKGTTVKVRWGAELQPDRQQGHHSTPWLSTLLSPPVNVPSFRPLSRATISARISSTSFGTVLSYIEIKSLGCG